MVVYSNSTRQPLRTCHTCNCLLGANHLCYTLHPTSVDRCHSVSSSSSSSTRPRNLLTVSGITLPPLLFLSYLNLDEGLSDFTLAWTRFVDIIIGIAAAVLIGTTIWPNHARVRYLLAVSNTMEKATDYCERINKWI